MKAGLGEDDARVHQPHQHRRESQMRTIPCSGMAVVRVLTSILFSRHPLMAIVRHHKMTDAEYLEQFNAEYWQTLEGGGVPALSRLQRDALCIMSFQGEINNGGMHQYLLNSSGDLAHETPDVMRRIGAPVAAEILEKANSYFGPTGPPTDRDRRMEMLLALSEDIERQIYDLTNAFYNAEDAGLSLADLFDAYVLSQRQT